jgi:hypothetical protein
MSCTILGDELYRLEDGRFQFLRSDETAPFIYGADAGGAQYVLADDELTSFLRSLDLDQVSFEPAVLWNRKTDVEVHTHTLVSIDRYIEANQVEQFELGGYQLCFAEIEGGRGGRGVSMRICVNSLLKDALEDAGFEYLQFY